MVLSTLTDGGTSTLTIALANNEAFGIQAAGGLSVASAGGGASYTFTLSGTGTFANGGVADPADFNSFGGDSLTLNAAGLARYTTIDITDADVSVGATSTSVNMLDSQGAAYSTNINITMNQNPEPGDVQIRSSSFTSSAGLDVETTGRIAVFNASQTYGIQTQSGVITLDAGTAGTLTGGIGEEIECPINSTSGAITLNGTGGLDSSAESDGVRLINGGLITTGSGPISITGTNGAGGGDGVLVEDTVGALLEGATSATGNISLTGIGGTAGYGVALSIDTVLHSTGTGTGAATITVSGSSSSGDGVYVAINPFTSISSVDGNNLDRGNHEPRRTATTASRCSGSSTISSTGTDAHAASISNRRHEHWYWRRDRDLQCRRRRRVDQLARGRPRLRCHHHHGHLRHR